MYKLEDLIDEASKINLLRYRKRCLGTAKRTFKMLFKVCKATNARYRLDKRGRIKKIKLNNMWYTPYLENNKLKGTTNIVYSEFGSDPSTRNHISHDLLGDLLSGTPMTVNDLRLA